MIDKKLREEAEALLKQSKYSLSDQHIMRIIQILGEIITTEKEDEKPILIYEDGSVADSSIKALQEKGVILVLYKAGKSAPQFIR